MQREERGEGSSRIALDGGDQIAIGGSTSTSEISACKIQRSRGWRYTGSRVDMG
jgi:hypothetical protein